MRRIIGIFLVAMMSVAACSAAMSNSRVRKETRFLTDKMAYELNLSTAQYNDVYEINYYFIAGIRYLMDDVMRGEKWALNRYYDCLNVRNDDLRWVLSSRQYGRFMQATHFYRPIYTSGNRWLFRVYLAYTNHNHFYFPQPYHYRTYNGAHCRANHHDSYYRGRYHHPHYTGSSWSIGNGHPSPGHYHSDFGSVNIRPGSDKRPAAKGKDEVYTKRRSTAGNKYVGGTPSRGNAHRNTRGNVRENVHGNARENRR